MGLYHLQVCAIVILEADPPLHEPALQASGKLMASCTYDHLFDICNNSVVQAHNFVVIC